MIFINPKISTYKQYDNAQNQNELKLKEVMSKIIVEENPEQRMNQASKKYGSGVAPVYRRELPVVYTNSSSGRSKKPKTFKL